MSAPVAAQDLPKNLRLVIGSTSTGGDTYQNSSIIAPALADFAISFPTSKSS